MSIRYVAAQRAMAVLTGPAGQVRLTARAANDNAASGRDTLLRDALKHFAQHGLRAAQVARDNAMDAHQQGDDAGSRHWIEICRALDRRMAAELAARITPAQ